MATQSERALDWTVPIESDGQERVLELQRLDEAPTDFGAQLGLGEIRADKTFSNKSIGCSHNSSLSIRC